MDDQTFEQDFVWYEWSFVSPEDVPCDDLKVRTEPAVFGAASEGFTPTAHRWDEEPRWTT
jgi:hypothetical protein